MLLTKKKLKKLIESYLIKENSIVDPSDLFFGIEVLYNYKINYDNDQIEIEDIGTFKDFLSGELDQRFIKHKYLSESTERSRFPEIRNSNGKRSGPIMDALKNHDVYCVAMPREYLDEENNQMFKVKLLCYFKVDGSEDADGMAYAVEGASGLEKSYNDAVFNALEIILDRSADYLKPEHTIKGRNKILVNLQQKYDEKYICTKFFHKYIDGEADYDNTQKQFEIKSLKTGKTATFSASELPYVFEEIEVFEIIPQAERAKTSFGTYSKSGLRAEHTDTNKEFVLPMA